jgi:putative addiction module component (TIGR02574 family)
MDPATLLQTVQAWPLEEQLDFAFRLWGQLLDSGWQPELTDDMKAELDRRLDSYEANPTNVLTWEQVITHVRRPK